MKFDEMNFEPIEDMLEVRAGFSRDGDGETEKGDCGEGCPGATVGACGNGC